MLKSTFYERETMKRKIIKPGLLLVACFVMQMADAMGMDAAVMAQTARKGAEPLDQQIEILQGKLLGVRREVAKHLQKKLPGKVDGVESAEALRVLIEGKKAALKVAKAGVKRTYVRWGSNLPGYDEFWGNQQDLEKEIPILETELPIIDRYERDQKVKSLEEELQRTRAAHQEATQKAKAEADRQAELRRQEDERRQKEEEDRQAALEAAQVVRVNKGATAIQSAFRGHKDRQLIVKPLRIEKQKQQEDDLVRNFLGYLGGQPAAALTKGSREARLASWSESSYNVFNQTNPDYTFVKERANADQYEGLFDLAVSYRAHQNPYDSHADNNWILKAREMGTDDLLPAAVKLVRHCSAVLDGKDVSKDGVLKAISDIAEDTLVTGGRIGLDLHRQATRAEMEVMIPALRFSGERAFKLAGDNVDDALAELARIYLDAAFKSQKGDTSARVIDYVDETLFSQHKAHCFLAATRGLKDAGVDERIEETFGERLGKMGAQIKGTRAYYNDFDR